MDSVQLHGLSVAVRCIEHLVFLAEGFRWKAHSDVPIFDEGNTGMMVWVKHEHFRTVKTMHKMKTSFNASL